MSEQTEETEIMLAALSNGEWSTSANLHAKTFPDMTLENARRKMRIGAEQSDGLIISGQQGYRLTKRATPEEKKRAATWLQSQARRMNRRAKEILAA